MKKNNDEAISLYVVDEHNEVFYCWQLEKYGGRLKKPTDLFHIDAHSDMACPPAFKKSAYFEAESPEAHERYYDNFARTELDIGNFVIPSVLTGLIRNVYFIYPHWRGLKIKLEPMNVCSVFGEGRVLKTNFKWKDKASAETAARIFPDTVTYNYYTCPIEKIPRNREVILDIDLDYFACQDAITNSFRYRLEITKGEYENRRKFLADRTLAFSRLEVVFFKTNGKFFTEISFKKILGRAHLPTYSKIESQINLLGVSLKERKCRPVLVTICRSNISGYCPRAYCKFVEKKLLRMLGGLFRLTAKK